MTEAWIKSRVAPAIRHSGFVIDSSFALSSFGLRHEPLTLTLCPEYRGEGKRKQAHLCDSGFSGPSRVVLRTDPTPRCRRTTRGSLAAALSRGSGGRRCR